MKVGDLVTLSAAGRKTQDVEARHKRFFVGPKSNYWNLAAEGQYVTDTNTDYWVAWQANPKPLSATQHRRGHLKFVKKHKKK